MCICFFQVNAPQADYPFIFCGNRDEFLSRDSLALHEWETNNENTTRTFGGVDSVRGGTWLACSSKVNKFRFAVVHNIRRAHVEIDQSKRSRGDLPKNFFMNNMSAKQYAERVNAEGSEYFGFTMVIADETGVYFTSNANGEVIKLKEGVYSISNALLDTPWPKVVHGKELFSAVLVAAHRNEQQLVQQCIDHVLKNQTVFPQGLPGVLDAALEIFLSSVNVIPFQWGPTWGLYGTRMHTVFLARRDGSIRVCEHSLDTQSRVKDWTAKWTSVEFDTKTFPTSKL